MLVIISMMLVITMKQYHQVIKVIVISVDVNCAHHKCDHQHDVDGDHQHDVGDHYEAISWQGGLVKVDWPVEAVMPFSLTSGRHRHHD